LKPISGRIARKAVSATAAFSLLGTLVLGTLPLVAPAEAAPGTPGVAQPGTVLFHEDFENLADGTEVPLVNYVGASGTAYTAEGQWANPGTCNGIVTSLNSPNNAACAGNPSSGGGQIAIRNLANQLGTINGSSDSANNHAVSAYTALPAPGPNLIEFATQAPIPVNVQNRFIGFSVNVAAINCFASPPLLNFYLVDNGVERSANTTPIAPCDSVSTFYSTGSVLFSGSSLGISMRNANGSGTGNDHAFDDIRVLDLTPQLDKAFSPASVPVGGTSALTLTVTNTSELAAKNGWSFTDALPAGLTVADGAAATTCPAGVVTAPAGATSVAVTGNLAAGMASCTVTVNVTAAAAGSFTNGPSNVTGVGINPPGTSTVTFVEEPWTCDASGYLFQSPGVPADLHLVQKVDLVSGAYSTAFTMSQAVNAVGYNTLDNFFYAIGNAGHLVRIGANGSLTDLGVPTGTGGAGFNVGDFDANGHYWVTTSASPSEYFEIDLVPGSLTFGTVVSSGTKGLPGGEFPGADWGFTNGAFYSVGTDANANSILVKFDPATGNQTIASVMTDSSGAAVGALLVGAVYVDASGYLYASDNTSGNIYRINTATGATILLSAGPAAAGNDGARCALAPIPTLTVSKTVEGRQAPADQFTVGLQNAGGTVLTSATTTGTATTVSTVDQPVSQGATYTITDAMAAGSAGAINAYNAAVTCTNTATGETVPTQGTGPWTFTVPSAAAFTCAVTNAPVDVSIGLVKSADQAAMENIEPGQIITYTFEFTNTGDVPLTDIRIDEGEFTGTGNAPVALCPAGTVAPDATVTCTATYTVTQGDVDAGSISNTATGTGTPPTGFPVPPVSPPSKVVVPAPPAPAITVVKTADEAAQASLVVGQKITYSFLVTNTGNVTLKDVTVNEGNFSGAGELSDVTCPAEAARLAPAAAITCTATYTVVQADVDAGSITNTATATGVPPGTTPPPVSPPSGITVPTPNAPAMTVLKTVDTDKATTVGQVLTYSFFLTNTGNVTLTNVSAVEGEFSGTGDLSAVTCPAEAASLAPAMSVTCTATYTVTLADLNAGTITNTATGTGTTPGGPAITSAPSTAKLATQAPVSAVNVAGNLANTGTDTGPLALGALLLVLLGGGTMAATKARRRTNQ
jgi:uncharacterized repeat protein (TIGR01451 family)